MLLKKLFPLLLALTTVANAQTRNFVSISSTDTEHDIIRKAAHVIPSDRQLRWQQLELTAFFHFGINTFTNNEWGSGKDDITKFNPTHLDAGQWVKTMKDAGFKQVILTAKHHDGFCLWPTKYTEHCIKNTPYKNGKGDIVKEVSEACKKYGMGFGIYLSPWDRNSPYYGDSVKYNDYFVNQLIELLTNYGRVDEVWFDGANGEGPNGKKQWYDFNRWYKVIRRLQPQAVIANMGPDVRWVGTESGRGRQTEWSVLPISAGSQKEIAAASQKDVMMKPTLAGNYRDSDLGNRDKILHANALIWYPAETDVSIRPGWFYHANQDSQVKTAGELMDIYFTSVGRNGVLLLNVPPDKDGLINESDIKNLQEWHREMNATFKVNFAGEAVIKCLNGIHTEALTDGRYNTYFTTTGKDTTTVIEFDLKQQRTFDVLSLQENISIGQRVEKFIAEYWQNNNWTTFAEGTTIGYKRLIKFTPITADKVRLRIESSRLNPTLSEFGLYKLAQ